MRLKNHAIRSFFVSPEDFARELFNTGGILDLSRRSGNMCILQKWPGDIERVEMYGYA